MRGELRCKFVGGTGEVDGWMHHARFRRTIPVLAAGLGLAVSRRGAYPQLPGADSAATFAGRVVDATDSAGIANAIIQVVGTPITLRSDARGRFHMGGIAPGQREIEIRAFGYYPVKRLESFAAGAVVAGQEIRMAHVPQLLGTMVVRGRSFRVPHGFEDVYSRATRGWGTLITREQIDSLNPRDLKTVLQAVPGVFANDRGVYFNRCYGNPFFGGETAELWIDGARVTKFRDPGNRFDPYRFNEFLTSIPPSAVQAVEVYTSSGKIPAEFAAGGSPCAVVAVWRRHGP